MADDQEHTGVGIFLIPEASDPIVAASSEPAHLTTVWLGDMNELDEDTIAAIRDEAAAYAANLDGPVVVPTTERGTLGDDGADVMFLDRTEALVALREGLLEASPTIRRVMDSVEQFPDWTPHVTLGYPETPAAGEYDGDAVTFDRIGLWVGPEQEDYPMSGKLTTGGLAADGSLVVLGNDGPEAVVPLREALGARLASFDMAGVIADVEPEDLVEGGLPLDELEDGEELITEIPVHGVATVEGRATGDGRGFRPNALSIGAMPQPLGYEYVSTHGGDTSNVAIVGRIDEYWREEVEDGVFELRWRGVIMPGKPYGAQAIESIVDGSYRGLSVIVDSVEVDVTEQREELRQRILADQAGEGEGFDIEAALDDMVGDGKQPTTWFSAARVRRFDMVPTGAFQEGYTDLGHEFLNELTPEQIEASVQALADCGCADSEEDAEAVVAAAFAPGTKDGPGWITHPIPTSRIRRYWVSGEGAAKIAWGTPGDFNRCRAQLVKYVQNPEWLAGLCANMHKEAIGVWPGQEGGDRHGLVAAGAVPAPLVVMAAAEPSRTIYPASAFAEPKDARPFALRIDREARTVQGYAATWDSCHIGISGMCQTPPSSPSNYSYFRKGVVDTDAGEQRIALLTMGIGHAGQYDSAAAATAHYDQTDAVRAYINIGENSKGIWYAGVLAPWVTDADIDAMRAIGRVSGDWRSWSGRRGDLEMVGLVVVNTEGFQLAASGGIQTAAIGLGSLPKDADAPVSVAASAAVIESELAQFDDAAHGVLTAEVVEFDAASWAADIARQVVEIQEHRVAVAGLAPARETARRFALAQARAKFNALTKE